MNELKTLTFKDGDISLDVIIKDNTGWLSTKQIATLFEVSRSTITRHISATYINNVVNRESTCAMLCISGQFAVQQTTKERSIPFYNLDIIEKIGRRLGSEKGDTLKRFVEINLNASIKNLDNEIVIFNNGKLDINVKVSKDQETVWLSQAEIALLFDTTQPNVSMHISNILDDSELDDTIYKDFLYVLPDGRQYQIRNYNLDMILAIGYRVKSKRAIQFRKWASSVLKQYIIKGYALNDERLVTLQDYYIKLSMDLDALKEKCEKLKNEESHVIFDNGQYYDAYSYIQKLIEEANYSITIIDPFFDKYVLKYLKVAKPSVIKRVCLSKTELFDEETAKMFRKQYGPIAYYKNVKFHDRFIIIDNTKCYAVGASLNHLGKKLFAVNLIESKEIIDLLLCKVNKSKLIYQ